ncbi:hypothetical protein C0J52_03546 [Blattella germanica]|nr:hypothetical protein C0J52_03546 [Blattella germanica]
MFHEHSPFPPTHPLPRCRRGETASAVTWGEGSDPIDRMQMSGVRGSDSTHVASRSRMTASPYSGPNDSVKRGQFINSNITQACGFTNKINH